MRLLFFIKWPAPSPPLPRRQLPAGLYVPYFLTFTLIVALACLLPPLPRPRLPSAPTSVTEVMEAASAAMEAAIAAPAAASSAADALVRDARLVWSQLMGLSSHIWHRWYAYAIVAFWCYYRLSAHPPVYVLDFAVFEPPASWRTSRADLVEVMRRTGAFTQESLDFMARLLSKSGTGDSTHWPPSTLRLLRDVDPATGQHYTTADRSMEAARAVAEKVVCDTVEEALRRTKTRPADVDFLIVNCSLFCPTPSLCAIIARHFKLRPTCRTFNLGGMGCSAGVISLDLAKTLLQATPNSLAVVVSTEEISQQLYMGNERSLLLQNTLFRVGGAAIVLSNKPVDGFRAKYKLLHTLRVQDNSDVAHKVVYQMSDPRGTLGVSLGKDITVVAGKALQANLTILGPYVLPIREQVKALWSYAHRWLARTANSVADERGWKALPFSVCAAEQNGAGAGRGAAVAAADGGGAGAVRPGRYAVPKFYVPDFGRGLQHFCIHAGGRAVIDGIEQNLGLERWRTAPSRATLYHWGNTSSSSIWYELRYCEGERGYNKGVPPAAGGAAAAAAITKASCEASSLHGGGGGSGSGARSSPPPRPADAAAASSATSSAARTLDAADPDAEAKAAGWDPERKWHLPDYEGRHIRPGDRVVQFAFGAGFKCNSAVLLRLR